MTETRKTRYPEIEVQLTGQDGNAMNLMAIVTRALRRAGHGDEVGEFMAQAMSGNYDHLLRTCAEWVSVT